MRLGKKKKIHGEIISRGGNNDALYIIRRFAFSDFLFFLSFNYYQDTKKNCKKK